MAAGGRHPPKLPFRDSPVPGQITQVTARGALTQPAPPAGEIARGQGPARLAAPAAAGEAEVGRGQFQDPADDDRDPGAGSAGRGRLEDGVEATLEKARLPAGGADQPGGTPPRGG